MRGRIIPLSILPILLAGCASITSLGNTFEGVADFRIVPDRDERYPNGPLRENAIPLRDFSLFQVQPSAAGADNPTFFSSGDYMQINLRSGMIGWFSEGVDQRTINGRATRGEIAIIANVTEGEISPGGVDSEGNLQGRVVFYSGDVYRQQRLNEFNVPIHGPARYGGGQLTIDMWVLELDRAESEQMGAVLRTLTNLASQIPGIAVPGLNVLNQIGTAFLNSNRDDVIGRIRITLSPPRLGAQVTDPILQVSDIVISRASRLRGDPHMLNSCSYYPRSGFVADGEPAAANTEGALQPCGEQGPNNRNNIFVLSIRKVPEGPSIASTVTLAQLNERIARLQVGTTSTPELNAAIDEIADVALSANTYSGSVAALARIQGGAAGAPHQLAADEILLNLQCALLVARDPAAAVITEVCGGTRAASRQMNAENVARLSARLTREMCFSISDLSFGALLGAAPTAVTLLSNREALYGRFQPRRSGSNPGVAC